MPEHIGRFAGVFFDPNPEGAGNLGVRRIVAGAANLSADYSSSEFDELPDFFVKKLAGSPTKSSAAVLRYEYPG